VLPTQLSLWRAPIDNERVGPRHDERWRALGLPTAHDHVALRTGTTAGLVTHEVTIPDEWDDIPRVGVRLDLPPEVVTVDWFGRGPHECYPDRQAGAVVGRWRTGVDDWGTRYVHPQANGNRTGVRWLRFLDADDQTVLVVDELEDLCVTVSRWTDEELDAASHVEDLPSREHAYLWIDSRHRGVGSAAVGFDVSAAHRIGPGTYRWSYRLRHP
jgi:beta-galactosidase